MVNPAAKINNINKRQYFTLLGHFLFLYLLKIICYTEYIKRKLRFFYDKPRNRLK